MTTVRTNLCLDTALVQKLKRTDLNWSQIANAALWRAVRNEPAEAETARLRKRVADLEAALAAIGATLNRYT
jgi:post-segregation antitoxin (ccd killing protein)